ncbi:hypothetical protein [Parvibaculum sp.]|uniref:hypothetical protein n=1 Tax=Parvibaculum sp. TaxID=2024848 RepID=UPI00391C204C
MPHVACLPISVAGSFPVCAGPRKSAVFRERHKKSARGEISPLVSVTLNSHLLFISRIVWIEMTTAEKPAKGTSMSAEQEEAGALAARLRTVIAREIADLEQQRMMARDESEGEKQARRIATLARSIDQLHEIEQAARRAKIDEHTTDRERSRAEDEALRASLAGRISRLAAVMAETELSRLADAEGGGASRA